MANLVGNQILIKVPVARDLITLLIDDCEMVNDWLSGIDDKCFQLFDSGLWDSYAMFLQDIADLFEYHGVLSKVVEFIEDWAEVMRDLFIGAESTNKKEMARVFTEDFWNELYNMCHLVNANLYGIEKRKVS